MIFSPAPDHTICALVPFKSLLAGKRRLSEYFGTVHLQQLVAAMLQDTLQALTQAQGLSRIIIVSNDQYAQELAAQLHVEHRFEPDNCSGLNEVVTATAASLQQEGVESLLVVHSDLPMLSVAELEQLISQHNGMNGDKNLSIVPDKNQQGSNCLLISPPTALPFCYGENSYSLHSAAAQANNIAIATVTLAGASCDIDYPEDIDALTVNENSLTYKTLATIRKASFETIVTNQKTIASPLDRQASLALANCDDLVAMTKAAANSRDQGFGQLITYSKKVFLPLTHLCRDVCHYCTFAQTPSKLDTLYMSVDEVVRTAEQGLQQGCKEALFTLGEKPELRYRVAREALAALGFASTLEYVAHCAEKVHQTTGILPHINAGCMSAEEIAMLKPVSASMGIMLESSSERLCEKGGPHFGSPDKVPAERLATIRRAGEAKVPFTSGILIGIGETRLERIESLLALRDLHEQYGHIQEIIIQNFRAKPDTLMQQSTEPNLEDLLWTIAVARLIFGAGMSIQAPPNLSPGVLPQLVNAGINDWGGVSPVTPDFVNPEAPWPHVDKLTAETQVAGKLLHERLTIYPRYILCGDEWLDKAMRASVLAKIDSAGLPRTDGWLTGKSGAKVPLHELELLQSTVSLDQVSEPIRHIVRGLNDRLTNSEDNQRDELNEEQITTLFSARGKDAAYLYQYANQLREKVKGDQVSYVVTRNINYTNICYFKCQFCAFSKGKLSENLRGRPYDLDEHEIARRAKEAWARGATEVCMQGGIHPDYTGDTYLNICRVVKKAAPDIHLHAFSPLEVWQGAATKNISVSEFLSQLKAAGLSTLPGTAAEILHDEVRAIICPDKITTEQWLAVMRAAHQQGLASTATIMFGHVDNARHWAAHLCAIRDLQKQTGGFTEFVPLPFVASEAPLYLKGRSRQGPSFREVLLMHAIARIIFHGHIDNIQASWVKLGESGVRACLQAGANDVGGTLMNETITRAAGADHGQEMRPALMERLIKSADRKPLLRNTLYHTVPYERTKAAHAALPLIDVINTPAKKYERKLA